MSTVSPPPSSAPFAVPPTVYNLPRRLSSSSPASQPNAKPPSVAASPPPTLSPQFPTINATSPSPASPPLPQSPIPRNVTSPPPASPPMASPTPPTTSAPPTDVSPPTFSPPPLPSSPPPTSSSPPSNSQPPPSPLPPASSSPPPISTPPTSSTPPKADPPPISPPPQPTPSNSASPPPNVDPPPTKPPPQSPPASSPPPPSTVPSAFSPPPPTQNPDPPQTPQSPEPPEGSSPSPPSPVDSPPSPASKPAQGSPSTPASDSPENSPASLPPGTSPSSTSPSDSVSPQLSPPLSSNSTKPSRTPFSPSVPSGGTATYRSSNNPADIGGIGTGGIVAIGIILALLLLGIIGAAGWCIWKRKKKASGLNGGYVMPTSLGSSPKSDSALLKRESTPEIGSGAGSNFVNSPGDPGGLGNAKIWFTYQELVEATSDFSAENLLGEGGFGSVFKGRLVDGTDVAVKQLNIGGSQGEREFRAEVEIISRIHHRHLVSIVGYCISDNRRLLVYDYVPNNTLYFHLHAEGRPVMDWATRVKIAVGAARGIAYLHEDCSPRIIHRDIKSANILLDNNFDARVADFGLARLAQDAKSHVTTRVVGTFGYMAPEYASSGKLTEKSDIYSFGVVLLELITGRKPVDISQPLGEESLVEWARPLLSHALEKEEFDQLADPRLEKKYVASEMFRMIEAAAACVRHSAAKRPGMGQIMRAFDSMAMSDLTNGMKVGDSAIYNSAEQSAEIRLFRRMAFGSQDFSSDFFSQGTTT